MAPSELVKAGKRLYGKRWKAPLARAIRRDAVTVWRYASGQIEIPYLVEQEIKRLLETAQALHDINPKTGR